MIRLDAGGLSGRRLVQLAALMLMVVAYAAQLVAAALPNAALLAFATVLGVLLDYAVVSGRVQLKSILGKVKAGLVLRQLLRDVILLLGLARLADIGPLSGLLPVAFGALACYVLHMGIEVGAVLVRRRRSLPVVTRNIDATTLRPTQAPPTLLTRRSERRLLYLGLPSTLGLLLTAMIGDMPYAIVGVALSLLALFGSALYLATWLRGAKRPVSAATALRFVESWLADYRPTVALYFSGGKSSAYQANMWLSTLSRLGERPVVVLRERFMVQEVGPTDVPILCLPQVSTLMRLEHSALRAVLHPANSGKTSQILRIPSLKHAFVNHGESDKLSSCNPYAKAYDEVWVAGPAARDRYALADVGVEDKDVVEVGRPQLDPIERFDGQAANRTLTTVLYAPTWEGWTNDPGNTSVILAGENLVRQLLADPAVRLIYKPHPMTGTVDPRAKQANAHMKEMIREANRLRATAAAAGDAPWSGLTAQVGTEELHRRGAELKRLTASNFRPGADELERMGVQGTPEPGRAETVQAATRDWETAYWGSLPPWEHQIITAKTPTLYSCFNESDLLISDVSSVVSDYLASEKPYAVANTSGLGERQYCETFPTVRAATILAPDGSGVPALLDSVRRPELDQLAPARRELKQHLLGPSEPSSMERFDEAAHALVEKAEQRARRMADEPAASGDQADVELLMDAHHDEVQHDDLNGLGGDTEPLDTEPLDAGTGADRSTGLSRDEADTEVDGEDNQTAESDDEFDRESTAPA